MVVSKKLVRTINRRCENVPTGNGDACFFHLFPLDYHWSLTMIIHCLFLYTFSSPPSSIRIFYSIKNTLIILYITYQYNSHYFHVFYDILAIFLYLHLFIVMFTFLRLIMCLLFIIWKKKSITLLYYLCTNTSDKQKKLLSFRKRHDWHAVWVVWR